LEDGSDLFLGDSSSFSFELMDFLKFFMPSPRDFPSSGNLRAPAGAKDDYNDQDYD